MTELERNTSDFMHRLAGDDGIDAANIGANSTDYGMEVLAYIPEEDRERARKAAETHGFSEEDVFVQEEGWIDGDLTRYVRLHGVVPSEETLVDEDLGDLLVEDSVIGVDVREDASLLVVAENLGPAPNAVDVFADHTQKYEVREVGQQDVGGAKSYLVRETGDRCGHCGRVPSGTHDFCDHCGSDLVEA